jgi:hypothetical protein
MKMDQFCKHNFLYKLHIQDAYKQQQIAVNRKHITQQMIKEFTPLLGYISWSSFQWIFCIIFSKCSNMCFTMLKMTNRWLQWLQNVQKPLAGLFRHLVWPKIEEDRLPGSSPSNLSLDRQNAPLPSSTYPPHAYMSKNPSPGATAQPVRTVGRLRALAPNRQGRGHMGHHMTMRVFKKGYV